MKEFMKFAAVGLAGYFIGFYEMKYKVVKTMCSVFVEEKQEREDSKIEESEEAQS